MFDIDAIKQTPISDIVAKYIPDLRQDGTEFKACCPFHDERTPSFTVSDTKGFYHCFSCGAHGDAIDFVMEYTGVDFRQAADDLGAGRINAADTRAREPVHRVSVYDAYSPGCTPPGDLANPLDVINPKRDNKRSTLRWVAAYRYGTDGYVLRMEIDGKKITPTVRWCDGSGWVMHPFDNEGRSMYRVERLNGDGQVLIPEGEKAADHLADLVSGNPNLSVVSWAGGTNGIDKTDWSPLAGRSVVLLPDNDEPGFKAMQWLRDELTGHGCQVKIVIPEQDRPKGWDVADEQDWTYQEFFSWCKANIGQLPGSGDADGDDGPVDVYQDAYPDACYEGQEVPQIDQDWRAELILKTDGTLVPGSLNNAQLLLCYQPDMVGVLAFNLFTMAVDVLSRPPWDQEAQTYPRTLTDVDDTRATAWLERMGMKLQIGTAHNAIVSAAYRNQYNPLQDYINALGWDGTPRVDAWLSSYFGVEATDYVQAVGKRFLIGAIARALEPGCKMDTMLILEGSQGLKKSTAVAALFGDDWFTDELDDMGSKDAAMQVQGVWGVEMSELTNLSRSEANRAKEWFSRRVDRFRPPYGRNIVSSPRKCVVVGTVNPEGGYLKDPTGGRRYWPVRCHSICIDKIRSDRDQIWAEAKTLYEAGERWWLEGDELEHAAVQQEDRYESDPWDDAVSHWTRHRDVISIADVMENCLELASSNQTQTAQNRIAKILISKDWRRVQRRIDGDRRWVYLAPGVI